MKIDKILKKHPIFNFAEDFKNICRPLEWLNITYFSHAHINHKNQLSIMAGYPEFIEHYIAKEYYKYDMHMAKDKIDCDFILWDLLEFKSTTNELQQDFNAYGRGHTFTLIQKSTEGTDFYHFAANFGEPGINQSYLQNVNELKRFVSYYQDTLSRDKSIKQAYGIFFPVELYKGGYLTVNDPVSMNLESFNEKTEHSRIFVPNFNVYLTKAEIACMHWLSTGKTVDEVAIILGIKHRTAKAHLDSAKDKLKCKNLFQLGCIFNSLPKFID